jgi:hypothetical protein
MLVLLHAQQSLELEQLFLTTKEYAYGNEWPRQLEYLLSLYAVRYIDLMPVG